MTKVIREQIRMMEKLGLSPRMVRFRNHPIYRVNYRGVTFQVTMPGSPSDSRAMAQARGWLRKTMRQIDAGRTPPTE